MDMERREHVTASHYIDSSPCKEAIEISRREERSPESEAETGPGLMNTHIQIDETFIQGSEH